MDSGEVKAAAAELPIQWKQSSMWGCSHKDSPELLKAVAQFPSLPINIKFVCLTAAIIRSLYYHLRLRDTRRKNKELQRCYKWTSYLYKEELEMIGDLDPNEAEEIYMEEPYNCPVFEYRSTQEVNDQFKLTSNITLLFDDVKSASSYKKNEAFFADRDLIESDNYELVLVESNILEDEARKLMFTERENYLKTMERLECKSYPTMMEGPMHERIGKKTKFNLSDEGACSEIKFNQSDDKERKERYWEKKHRMKNEKKNHRMKNEKKHRMKNEKKHRMKNEKKNLICEKPESCEVKTNFYQYVREKKEFLGRYREMMTGMEKARKKK